jgi:hypothetical protein
METVVESSAFRAKPRHLVVVVSLVPRQDSSTRRSIAALGRRLRAWESADLLGRAEAISGKSAASGARELLPGGRERLVPLDGLDKEVENGRDRAVEALAPLVSAGFTRLEDLPVREHLAERCERGLAEGFADFLKRGFTMDDRGRHSRASFRSRVASNFPIDQRRPSPFAGLSYRHW